MKKPIIAGKISNDPSLLAKIKRQIGNIRLHGQVFLTSWILLGDLLVFISLGTKKMENDTKGLQNLLEFLWDYIRDLAGRK